MLSSSSGNLSRIKFMQMACAAAIVAAAGTARTVQAAGYVGLSDAITASLGGGTTYTATPLGLNSSDQVVGFYQSTSSSSSQQAFIYTPATGVVTVPGLTAGYNVKAYGINDAGTVVGSDTTIIASTSTNGAFYLPSGAASVTQIAPVTSSGSTTYSGATINATGINNSGVIVGSSTVAPPTSSSRAFVYQSPNGTATDIGTGFSGSAIGNYGSNSNLGYAVNDSGQVAGYGPSVVNSSTKDPYLATPTVTPGTYTYANIGTAIKAVAPLYNGASTGGFEGIDAAGNVAGNYTISSGPYSIGFLYNSTLGTVTSITDTLGSGSVYVYGMSDVAGNPEVVGQTTVSGTINRHAFVDVTGVMYDLNTLDPVAGYTLINAYAINGSGDIVATGETSSSGPVEAFLLTGVTVPEPSSLGIIGLGIAGLASRRRAHR